MSVKNGLICLLIVALLSLCTFNGVAAVSMNKLTPNIHSSYAGDLRGRQQTCILATLDDKTAATIGVDQSISLGGVLSYDIPPANSTDSSHGIPNATLNVQSLNPDGRTWSTVAATSTDYINNPIVGSTVGWFGVTLTPKAAGVYVYRITYDGDSQYAPAISNVVTLTVTNVAIS